MKKMTTFFEKTEDQSRVINQVRQENKWVLTSSKAYRKFDGMAIAVIDGKLYKRYDAKIGRDGKRKIPPLNSIPCQEPDEITGHQPFWTPVLDDAKDNRRMLKAFINNPNGTYEFCGEKVNGNPENIEGHKLIPHLHEELNIEDLSFDGLKKYLRENDIEGIVFWNTGNSEIKCKIRKTDFGIKR